MQASDQGTAAVDWKTPVVPKYGSHPRYRGHHILGLQQEGRWLVRIGDDLADVQQRMGAPDKVDGDGIKGPFLLWHKHGSELRLIFDSDGRLDVIYWWAEGDPEKPVTRYDSGGVEVNGAPPPK